MSVTNNENENKVLIDALKYTSDIIVSITDKMNSQEEKLIEMCKQHDESKLYFEKKNC